MRTVDVTDDLQAYLDGLVPPRDDVLARIEEEAHRESIPIVDPHEGQLLYLLVKIAGAKRILELVDPGALLMSDNALRQGEVLHPDNQQARNVRYYNELVSKHPRLESVVIPIRDGLSLARVKE